MAGNGDYSNSIWLRRDPPDSQRRPRRGTPPLSRERLAQAAVALLDRDGLAGFSMRALAVDLSVSPMSAYWYVENKDQLLELALDQVFAETALAPEEDGPDLHWRLRAGSFAGGLRAAMLRHPWAAQLTGSHLTIGPNAVRVSGQVTEILRHAGLPPEELQPAIAAFLQYVFGVALTESQWHERFETSEAENAFYRDVFARINAANAWPETVPDPPEDYDVREHRDRNFAYGIETVLDGLEAKAARAADRAADRAERRGPTP